MGPAGSGPAPRFDRGNRVGWTFESGFDAAVGEVADEAGDAVGVGLSSGTLPEPDSLDPPGNPQVSAHGFGGAVQT